MFYAQLGTNLPVYLSYHFANYTRLIAALYLFSAGTVVLLQVIVSRLVRNMTLWILISLSFLSFAVASFGYAWAPSVGVLLVAEFVFTVADMVGIPQLNHLVSQIAPGNKRALYFSIYDSRVRIGEVLGPLWGGWLMTVAGGGNSFRIAGLLVLAGGLGTVVLVRRLILETGSV